MAATLTPSEYNLYYKLQFALLFFVQRKYNVPDNATINSPEQLRYDTTTEDKLKVRECLYEHIDSIGAFTKENPEKFTEAELAIIESWKHFLKGRFYIMQYLKDYAIFLSAGKTEKAYGVKALMSDFDEVVSYDPPVLVDAVLLPFKNQIIYDGLLSPAPVLFGPGIRRDLQQSYQEAKARFGIIMSLPEPTVTAKQNDEELLKFYLKNEKNREYYTEEIQQLLDKKPKLIDVYHQAMGQSHARSFIKTLHSIGITRAWFATIQGVIVASGTSQKEVEQNVKRSYLLIE